MTENSIQVRWNVQWFECDDCDSVWRDDELECVIQDDDDRIIYYCPDCGCPMGIEDI